MNIKSKSIIYCDIDNTIFPLIETMLPKYNQKYNDNLQFENITDYDINKFIKSECKSFFKEFATEDVWLDAKPYKNSIEILAQINNEYDLYFCTAGHPNTMKFRDDWLNKYFSFYSSSQLIMIRNKQLLIGDLLIDDASHNLINGTYKCVLFNQNWNKNSICKNRIYKWDDNLIELINSVIRPCLKIRTDCAI